MTRVSDQWKSSLVPLRNFFLPTQNRLSKKKFLVGPQYQTCELFARWASRGGHERKQRSLVSSYQFKKKTKLFSCLAVSPQRVLGNSAKTTVSMAAFATSTLESRTTGTSRTIKRTTTTTTTGTAKRGSREKYEFILRTSSTKKTTSPSSLASPNCWI